jgi:hypothetical protein
MTDLPISPIMERIVRTDVLSLVVNGEEFLRTKRRVVDLACGHRTITAAQTKAACPRCREMLRRSITTGDEDYDTFRNRGGRDRMVWADDPCRTLNEPTDLSGRLLTDAAEDANG